MDQILDDQDALDGLAFAYVELRAPERRALAQAVLEDANDPSQALAAFIAVEDDPGLRRRLAGMLRRHGHIGMTAWLEDSGTSGEALLIQSIQGFGAESLRIVWNSSEIQHMEIESRHDFGLECPVSPAALRPAIDTLTPLLWRHVRSGGPLPDGIERFAGFFSAR